MNRQNRQNALMKIIAEKDVSTQQALKDLLSKEGYKATQATVSRDIAELGLVKNPGPSGKMRYVKPLDPKFRKLSSLFHQSVISISTTGPFVIIKTIAGAANSACILIDSLNLDEVLGTIAGDDTIFIAVSEKGNVEELINKLNSFLI